MALITQVTVYGLIAGCFYALLGAAWNIIYDTTRTFHFAHGTVFVAAGYTAALLYERLGLLAASSLAVLVAILLGIGIELFLYRPLRRVGAVPFVLFISSLGMFILGENLVVVLFTAVYRNLGGFPIIPLFLGPVTFTTLHVLIVIVSLSVLVLISLFLTRTSQGKAIRAVACNPDMAEVIGIDKENTFVLAFALGSAAAGVAAILWALDKGVLPTMSITPLFAGFVVSIVGGIGSMRGAVIAGIILGLVENLSLIVLPAEMSTIMSFLVLVLVLIARPTGLFASEVRKLI